MRIQLFGATLQETKEYFLGVTAGKTRKTKPRTSSPGEALEPADVVSDRIKIWSRLIVSSLAMIGGISLLVVGDQQQKQAGAGFVGLVLGYWLR